MKALMLKDFSDILMIFDRHIGINIRLKCMFMLFNILLYSQINISLWTNFIFTDHLSIWLVNYRSFYSRSGSSHLTAIGTH